MAKTRAQKEIQLKNLTDHLSQAKSVVFADFKGMTMKQLSQLRKLLREQNAEFIITKNTILLKAIEDLKLKIENSYFSGPTATLFSYDDEISPIKALVQTLKETGIGKVKAGLLGANPLSEEEINKLASLPARDELKGKIVGVLVAPLQGLLNVLQGNLRNLVYVLSEIQKASN